MRRTRIRKFATASLFAFFITPPVAIQAQTQSLCLSPYVVQAGDTLWSISRRCNWALASLTVLSSRPSVLHPGDRVVLRAIGAVPTGAVGLVAYPTYYKVHVGDTLDGIAAAHHVTGAQIARANNLQFPYIVRLGRRLLVPAPFFKSVDDRATTYATTYRRPFAYEIEAILNQQADRVGVDRTLLKAIAWRESAWQMVDATDGGIGVMQLMPYTVTWLRRQYIPGSWSAHSVIDNIHAGAVLLHIYSLIYGGNERAIVMAYHGGSSVVGKQPTLEMRRYIRFVLAFQGAFQNGMLPR